MLVLKSVQLYMWLKVKHDSSKIVEATGISKTSVRIGEAMSQQ